MSSLKVVGLEEVNRNPERFMQQTLPTHKRVALTMQDDYVAVAHSVATELEALASAEDLCKLTKAVAVPYSGIQQTVHLTHFVIFLAEYAKVLLDQTSRLILVRPDVGQDGLSMAIQAFMPEAESILATEALNRVLDQSPEDLAQMIEDVLEKLRKGEH